MIDRLDRLVDRAPAPVAALIRTRLGIDAFIVIAAVFVVFRLLDVYPWTASVLDLHTYWATRDGIDYASSNPFIIGAYLYAPAFAQLIAPLTGLSWPVFAAIWTALIAAVYLWLVGRWAVPLLLSLAVALELFLGQIDVFLAAAIVVGFRYPAAWAFPILTKIAPGIGLIWFVVRSEWRNLALALAATIGIAAISAAFTPDLWRGWLDLVRRSLTEPQTIEGAFLAVPIWLRLPVGVGLIAWGARTDRYWTLPVGILLSMPILWVNVFTILIALVPLRHEFGSTAARAWLLRTASLKPALAPAEPG
ncbi:MAG TPA: glycosyltransferase family 87 protein [Candidatus Eisenbacteria bacterium]|nr:glycosyltransferase family 87 protein [Candidatus Eisenbacteria bacterium]